MIYSLSSSTSASSVKFGIGLSIGGGNAKLQAPLEKIRYEEEEESSDLFNHAENVNVVLFPV
mgnify:CR=1 FL=1